MMVADAGAILRAWGTNAAALTALLMLAALLSKLSVIRWLFRQLVSEPLGRWFREQVDEAIKKVWHLIHYHLGSNDTTTPFHERLSRLEVANGLEPVEQQDHDIPGAHAPPTKETPHDPQP